MPQPQAGNTTQGQHPDTSTSSRKHKVELWIPILSALLGAAVITFLLAYVVNRFTWRNRFRRDYPDQQFSWTFWISNTKYYCPNHGRTLNMMGRCKLTLIWQTRNGTNETRRPSDQADYSTSSASIQKAELEFAQLLAPS